MRYWRALEEGRVPADRPLLPALTADNMMVGGGPDHGRHRAAWDAAPKPFQDPRHPQYRRLRTMIRSTADELITLLAGEGGPGTVDLAAEFIRPLTVMVAGELLGASGWQSEQVLTDIWEVLDAGADASEAGRRVRTIMEGLVDEKRVRPGEDFPSYMLAARPDLTSSELAYELSMPAGMIAEHGGLLVANAVVEIIAGDGQARSSMSGGMIREAVNYAALRKPCPGAPRRDSYR
ncbi:hypothetical protein ACIO1C_15510 [Streptomyces sp. NPDC087420]|uniref:hypothetical protein n=1 Tax=Streptomyces sp. NPDC087420 TaxID=3365785 RepID=UPI003833768B